MGINPESMRKASMLGASSLELLEELMPEPDAKQVAALTASMKAGFD
jgi:hypothetical protein